MKRDRMREWETGELQGSGIDDNIYKNMYTTTSVVLFIRHSQFRHCRNEHATIFSTLSYRSRCDRAHTKRIQEYYDENETPVDGN